eukprot:3863183-Pyramimonas_sp.AAC.1
MAGGVQGAARLLEARRAPHQRERKAEPQRREGLKPIALPREKQGHRHEQRAAQHRPPASPRGDRRSDIRPGSELEPQSIYIYIDTARELEHINAFKEDLNKAHLPCSNLDVNDHYHETAEFIADRTRKHFGRGPLAPCSATITEASMRLLRLRRYAES